MFFLNLEDGYFGCQVNESTEILQLLELSKLCDNHVDCYQGTDEQRTRLKCTGKRKHNQSPELVWIALTNDLNLKLTDLSKIV